jgi:hypothetical protein
MLGLISASCRESIRLRRLRAGCLALVFAVLGCRSAVQPPPPTPGTTALPKLQVNPDLVKSLKPSNNRDWSPQQAVLPWAEFHGDKVTVHNIRNTTYRSIKDYDVSHYDKTFDLDRLTSVDFIVVPFNDAPEIAHTALSFGFGDEDYVVCSVEIRRERGEEYGALKGFFRQYEIMYVLVDERDFVMRNAKHNMADVYIHRAVATPEQVRTLFLDVLTRTNKLAREPEFYNTLSNNCTTNIRDHINKMVPGRIPYDYRVLMPGHSDRLAFELGLLDTDTTFEQTRHRNRVNYEAFLHEEASDFSQKIRR